MVFVALCYILSMNGRGRPRERKGRRGRFGERLRAARREVAVTQAKAADLIGVDRVTVARWETGSSSPRGAARRFVELWIAAALGEEVSLGF